MNSIVISLIVASLCVAYFVYGVRRDDPDETPIDFSLIRTAAIIFIIAAGIVYYIASKDRSGSSYDYRDDLDYCDRYGCRGTR